jgi:GntR family transcriptional regulator
MAEPPIVVDAYHQVKDRLNDLVERFAADGEFRLPAEDQLSTMLGVSRPTVRSALLSLQKEGKIQRFHGRGTFINRYALTMKANLAEDRPFLDLLTHLGHKATLRTLSVSTVVPGPAVAGLLGLDDDSQTCAVNRIFEADGTPAVLSCDYVPLGLLTGDVDDVSAGDSTFMFVAENTRGRVQYSIAELIPTVADKASSRVLSLKAGTPMLMLRHLHLNERQEPVAVTDALVNDDILRFSMVRTYLDS